MNHCLEECTFIIFGATGDLSKRKLLPAMYKLIEDNVICKFAIIGISIDNSSPQKMLEQSKPFIKKGYNKIWENLEKHLYYYSMDFHNASAYEGLAQLINDVEKKHNLPSNRMFYLATMPDHFVDITKNLAANNIARTTAHQESPWSRVVYEKPFGNSLISSQKINKSVTKVFKEHQIYRIDHYLGKELVGNIALARFTNIIFEPLWNNKYIDAVHINLSETIGIEKRGVFYDSYGALRDMIQSHALQMLALVAMEQPKRLTAEMIRNAKAQVLKKVSVIEAIRGQYEGYLQEDGIQKSSATETYAALMLNINNKRWKGVPFYVTSGKSLDSKENIITLIFKKGECLLTSCPSVPNFLTIKISPDEGLYLGLNNKIPGSMDEVTPVTMDFCHSCLFGPNTPEAYETLLVDVVKGDQSAFVRSDEVESSWKIVDEAKEKMGSLLNYKKGSCGPKGTESYLPITKKLKIQ